MNRMHSSAEKKEAIRKFKERIAPRGAFALRCVATGQSWVGSSQDLNAIENRFWFCLRNGVHPDKTLQEVWNMHGEHAFQFEILEKLDEDLNPLVVGDLLKEKRLHWIAQLGAQPV